MRTEYDEHWQEMEGLRRVHTQLRRNHRPGMFESAGGAMTLMVAILGAVGFYAFVFMMFVL